MFLRVEKRRLKFAEGQVAVGDSVEVPDKELDSKWVKNLIDKGLVTTHARNPSKPSKQAKPATAPKKKGATKSSS